MIRVLLILAIAACAAGAEPTSVTLRGTARVLPAQEVTVGDVAVLAGPMAEVAARALVLSGDQLGERAARGWVRVTAQDVIRAIGIDPPGVLVRGSVCSVGVLAPAPPGASGPVGGNRPGPVVSGGRVCDAVIERLVREFGVPRDDLRITFDDRYAEPMTRAVGACTIEVHPTGRATDMPMSVTLYEDERIVLSQTVRVRVELRRSVPVTDALIERRSTLDPAQYHFETRWTAATDEPAAPEQLDGATARTTLVPGEVIEAGHVEAPVIVRRGDLVAVRVLSGTIVARITARAMSDGRDGHRVQFEAINGGRRFYARMNGPGRAVLNQSPGAFEE